MKTKTITAAALVARINRKLASDHRVVRKARGSGAYYVLDARLNCIEPRNEDIDLERFAQTHGALHHGERLAA